MSVCKGVHLSLVHVKVRGQLWDHPESSTLVFMTQSLPDFSRGLANEFRDSLVSDSPGLGPSL